MKKSEGMFGLSRYGRSRVNLVVSAKQFDFVVEQAQKHNLSMAGYIRELVNRQMVMEGFFRV